jgi:pyruvate formate lyase activating enzyme
MSADKVFETVMRDKSFYDNTGGGLTLSGGEVLAHVDFAEELISLCAKEGVNSCIDTSGYAKFEVLDRLAALPGVTDILYDIKVLDDDIHQKYTGVSNKSILDNLTLLSEKHGARVKIHARLPLIKDVNDDLEMLTRTAEFLIDSGISPDSGLPRFARNDRQKTRGHTPAGNVPMSFDGNVPVSFDATLIPYHNLGVSKARNIGETATTFEPPDDEKLQQIKTAFATKGIPTTILAEE